MDDEDANAAEGRPPEVADLLLLGRALNEAGAKYLIVGGFAIIHHGFARATMDIDFLVESSLENQQRVRKALECLPEKAILEFGPEEDMRDFAVVRVADEIVVDVMLAACGIEYAEAQLDQSVAEIDGVQLPFASAKTMLRMKQTHRAKDEDDRVFLQSKLAQAEKKLP